MDYEISQSRYLPPELSAHIVILVQLSLRILWSVFQEFPIMNILDIENQIGIVIQTNQYNEQVYNHEMPELLFGEYKGTASDYTGCII